LQRINTFKEISNPVTSFKATALSLEALATLDKMSDSVLSNLLVINIYYSFKEILSKKGLVR
jgi:hypothetical protein